ncbi:MAG: flippase [Elusimicrobiota bacterium]|jgi:O-antigen/teichoic acid export membrane protein
MTSSKSINPPSFTSPANNIGASAILLGGGQFLTRLINFGWMIYFAKHLGPSDFGLYNTTMSFVALVLPVSNFGISLAVIREATRRAAEAPKLFGSFFWIRLLSSLVLWTGLMIVLPVLGYPQFMWKVFLLAGAHLAVTTITQVGEAIYIAHQRTSYLWATQLASAIGWALLGFCVLSNGKGLNWLFGAMVLNSVLIAAAHAWVVKHRFEWPDFTLDRTTMVRELKEGAPMGGVSLFNTAGEKLDRVLLSLFCAPLIVGYYSLASILMLTVVETVWHPFMTVLYPIMSRAGVHHDVDLPWICRKAILWTAVLAFPATATLLFFSSTIVQRIWGMAYEPTGRLLALLACCLPFVAWNRIFGNLLITSHEEKAYFQINAGTFVMTLSLNCLLMPRFGADAAAWVFILSQVVQSGLYFLVIRKRIHRIWEPLRLTAVLGTTLLCFAPLLWVPHRLVAFLIIIPIFIITLYWKLFDEEDRTLAKRWTRHLLQIPTAVVLP